MITGDELVIPATATIEADSLPLGEAEALLLALGLEDGDEDDEPLLL